MIIIVRLYVALTVLFSRFHLGHRLIVVQIELLCWQAICCGRVNVLRCTLDCWQKPLRWPNHAITIKALIGLKITKMEFQDIITIIYNVHGAFRHLVFNYRGEISMKDTHTHTHTHAHTHTHTHTHTHRLHMFAGLRPLRHNYISQVVVYVHTYMQL